MNLFFSIMLPMAGMPAILPDSWEFEPTLQQAIVRRLDAISFFIVAFVLSTWIGLCSFPGSAGERNAY